MPTCGATIGPAQKARIMDVKLSFSVFCPTRQKRAWPALGALVHVICARLKTMMKELEIQDTPQRVLRGASEWPREEHLGRSDGLFWFDRAGSKDLAVP